MDLFFKTLSEKEIVRSLFQDFIRTQNVTKCRRLRNGVFVEVEDLFVDDWTESDYAELIHGLRKTAESGGLVEGAFADGKLKGFVSVENNCFGCKFRYMDLSNIYVSADFRGKGIGTRLFDDAKKYAAKCGAEKLYISAHSAIESQAFYEAMQCVEAKEYDNGHVEKEPCDCQLECDVGLKND